MHNILTIINTARRELLSGREDPDKIAGNALRELLDYRGINPKDAHSALGIGRSTLYDWISGKIRIQERRVTGLIDLLKLDEAAGTEWRRLIESLGMTPEQREHLLQARIDTPGATSGEILSSLLRQNAVIHSQLSTIGELTAATRQELDSNTRQIEELLARLAS